MENNNDLKSIYDQLFTSYHSVGDFKVKLLAILRLVSGFAIFDLIEKTVLVSHMPLIGSFGAATGIGLYL